jgi:hypothetical protein
VDMFRNKYSLKNIAIFLILPIVFMVNFVNVLDSAIGSDIFVLTHLDYSYNDKMRESWGLYYDYIKFVKENTPENASILVPPQQTPWLSTGNVGLDRYFLYPRILVNGGVDASDGLGKYDYVLLVWGEWNGADKNSYGWPREKIKTDKIIYFDPATKAVREKNENFDPMLLPTSGAWGIIKLR